LALSSGFTATTAKAAAAQTRLVTFGLTVKSLAASLAAPIILTIAIVGAELVIRHLRDIKAARDGLAQERTLPRGEAFVQSIGGRAATYETLVRNANDAAKALEAERRTLKNLEESIPEQAKTSATLSKEDSLLKSQINLSRQRIERLKANYSALIKAIPDAQREGVIDFPIADDGASSAGAGAAGKELQDYVESRIQLLGQLGQIEQNRIALMTGLSNEEMSVMQALANFRSSNAINDRQLLEDERQAVNYSIETRDLYLASIKERHEQEQDLIGQRLDLDIYSPLLALEKQLINQNHEATASLQALKEGRTELTEVEKAGLFIAKLQLGAKDLGLDKARIDNLLKEASVLDAINKKRKEELALLNLRNEIAIARAITPDAQLRLQIDQEFPSLSPEKKQEIFNLTKVKQNLEETRALIDGFVSQISGDYKGFLKAVISGEDAADALKQFQQGLTDKVLTIVLDFAMAPVEKFFEEELKKIFFGKDQANTGIDGNTTAVSQNTLSIDNLTAAVNGLNLSSVGGVAMGQISNDANYGAVSENISKMFAEAATATDEGLDKIKLAYGGSVDLLAKTGQEADQAGNTFNESLGKTVGAIGIAAGSIMGIAAGISQIKEGGVSGVLGGIGSILMSAGGAIGGFANLSKAANGAVWTGGFQAFANGGVVKGPTLGLVGEGKYNEAIVPLPDGRSIPVQMKGQQSSRELLSNNAQQSSSPSILSMKFETTRFGDTDYVDVKQLEQAMAETRKAASRDGASRGASLALDRLQNSPTARRKIGLR